MDIQNKEIRQYIKIQCLAKKPLLTSIFSFNFFLSRHLHPDWMPPSVDSRFLTAIQGKPLAEFKVSGHLLDVCGIKKEWYFDFSIERFKVALLPVPALNALAQKIGLALAGREICLIISSKKVFAIRRDLGEANYQYIMEHSPCLRDNVPECTKPEGHSWSDWVMELGVRCLYACIDTAPYALKRRVQLKLPQKYYRLFAEGVLLGNPDKLWQVVKQTVERELEAEWNHLS